MAKDLKSPMFPACKHIHFFIQMTMTFFMMIIILLPTPAFSDSDHKIYFKDTDHELHVYEIRGEFTGNTLLIIGGMHNEPGGYLSADLYADFSLYQGNLIVVPRANFPVIISNNRKIHSDMNRKFTNGKKKSTAAEYEESVVEILKQLMARSNVLLNLHDGSGFYRPTYETKMKNPHRWGQCIITDTDTYATNDGQTLELKERVERILAIINPGIKNREHHFHYNNTRTFEEDSPHKEQRGSATYYALTEYNMESYGVETSKSIPSLDLKVRYQSMVINAYMDEFGIIPNNPKVAIHDPELQYLLVSVNGSFPYGVPHRKTLYLNPGDRIRIEHIAANYERGLMADIQGIGSLNDMNKEFIIQKPYTVLVKKDQFECGKIFLDLNPDKVKPPPVIVKKENVESFLVLVNNQQKDIPNGKTLSITTKDTLVIQDITPVIQDSAQVKINFVGFVGNKTVNDAEDRGYTIRSRNLWKRHSVDKKGGLYRVEATLGEKTIGEMYVRIGSERNRR